MAFTHIVAPTDFSATGNHALQYAFEEATLHGAKVTLVHVLHHQPDTRVYFSGGNPQDRMGLRDALVAFPSGFDPDTGGRLPSPSHPAPTTVRQDFDEIALEKLRELVPSSFTGTWDTAVASGDPAHAIVHVAEAHAADLIVMGTHGHTGLHRLVLGSVAEHVVRRAPCAVLTVRGDQG